MDTTNQLCGMLEEKKQLFLQYEKDTEALLSCEIEAIDTHMKNRKKISEEIDRMDALLDRFASEDEKTQEIVRQALKNSCSRSKIPTEFCPVFDCAQQIFSIIHRVQQMESRAEERIKFEQEILLEQIKKLNRSTPAQASKFYGTVGAASQDSFFPTAYKKA